MSISTGGKKWQEVVPPGNGDACVIHTTIESMIHAWPPPPPPPQDPDAEALRNPTTAPAELARIAGQRPDLHPAVAAHPQCYPALTAWITARSAALRPQPQNAIPQQPAQPSPPATPFPQPTPSTPPQSMGRPRGDQQAGRSASASEPPADSQQTDRAGDAREQSDQSVGTEEHAPQPAAEKQASKPYDAGKTGHSAGARPDKPNDAAEESDQSSDSAEQADTDSDQDSDEPSGVRRRSMLKTLSIGAGIVTVGAIGAGAWWATHRSGSHASDPPFSPTGTFSMRALDSNFLIRIFETWNVPAEEVFVAPKNFGEVGSVPMMAVCQQPGSSKKELRVYPCDFLRIGDPDIFPLDKDGGSISQFSVASSWWDGDPLLWDTFYDTRSKTISPVPWDVDNMVFLGSSDEKTAILVEVPHDFENETLPPSQGAVIAVNRQGQELWRTSGNYVTGYLDPLYHGLLIGYQKESPGDDPELFSVTPHIINTDGGAVQATLSPVVVDRSGSNSGSFLLTRDGFVCFSNDGATMTANAYTFYGELEWTLTGAFSKIIFTGIPSTKQVSESLASWDGSSAIIAENGVALIQTADGSFSREGTGTAIALGEYHTDKTEPAGISYLTLLTDGSGVLAETSGENESVRMIDTSTGKEAWSKPGHLAGSGLTRNQATVGTLPTTHHGVTRTGLHDSCPTNSSLLVTTGSGPSAITTWLDPLS